jgi:hypothetical protein
MLNLHQYIIPSQSSQQIYMEHNFGGITYFIELASLLFRKS